MTTFDPIPQRFKGLLHERDGPRCSLTNVRHKDSILPIESAHVIPSHMLDGIELAQKFVDPHPDHAQGVSGGTCCNEIKNLSDCQAS